MRDGFIGIDWTAQALSQEQRLVLLKVAALFHSRRDSKDWLNFTHLLVEGRLTHVGTGRFVTIPGDFYHADLGLVKGVRWTVDFLIVRGSEHYLLNNEQDFASFRNEPDGSIRYHHADRELTHVTDVSLLD